MNIVYAIIQSDYWLRNFQIQNMLEYSRRKHPSSSDCNNAEILGVHKTDTEDEVRIGGKREQLRTEYLVRGEIFLANSVNSAVFNCMKL